MLKLPKNNTPPNFMLQMQLNSEACQYYQWQNVTFYTIYKM